MKRKARWTKLLFIMSMCVMLGIILPHTKVNAETLTEGDYQYTVLTDGTVMITDYTGNARNLTIPTTLGGKAVTVLGTHSFRACTSLVNVIIPEGVKWIGETSSNVQCGAFDNCSSLESVSIPSSVTHIRGCAFFECDKLKNVVIPEGVTTMEWGAFEGCDALTEIELPVTLSELDQGVFGNCPNLKKLVVKAGNSNYYSEGNCVIEKATKNLIQGCSGSSIPNDVKSIDWNAFYGCTGLENVVIPDSVTIIQPQAFSSCRDLKSVKISKNVTAIPYRGFNDCGLLESVELPEGLISIGQGAFGGCNLKRVDIPEGVTVIDNTAFGSCYALEQINIPNTVTTIGTATFAHCRSLKNITLPTSVTTIGNRAFMDCSALESIVIPDGVTTIGDKVFCECNGLKKVTIPSSVTVIAEYAFGRYDPDGDWEGAICLTDKIDATYYVAAGSYAETWAKDNDLKIKYIPGQEPVVQEVKPAKVGTELVVKEAKCTVKVTSSDSKNPTVQYMGTTNKKATTVKVPDTVTVGAVKYKVTSIANKALSGNKKVTKVTIGKNVKTIGKDAFKNCTKLKTVEIKSTTLNKIGANAFSGDKKLTRITLKTTKLTKKSIGKNALKGTNKKLVVKVPKKKVSTYKKYFKNKGNKTVKVKK